MLTVRRALRLLLPLLIVLLSLTGCLRKPGEHPQELTYKLPTKISVPVGGVLPGTGIRYEGIEDNSAQVLIGGQKALKRKGDSLNWEGDLLDGVSVDLKLRVIWYTEQELHLVGTAKVTINNVHPEPSAIVETSTIRYDGAVAYGLAKGAVIPGSTIVYEGKTEQGAKLSGVEGYPYRAEGDSVVWKGTLRPDVYVRLSLRVVQYSDKGLRVAGLVSLWIGT